MNRRLPHIALAALVVYWLALFTLTHLPRLSVGETFSHADKLAHFFGFAALAWLGAMVLRLWQVRTGTVVLVVLTVGAAYAALDEWLQNFTHRHADFYDWVADVLGIIGGLLVFLFTYPLLRRLHRRWKLPRAA